MQNTPDQIANQIARFQPISVSVVDGAKMVGLSKSRLYELMADGTLPHVKVGQRRLIRVSDLKSLVGEAA